MVRKEISDYELEQSLGMLMNIYSDQISYDMQDFIVSSAVFQRDDDDQTDILMQALDEVGALENNNSFFGFVELLNSNFGLNQDIIEVGSGLFSRVGHRIALKQKNNKTTAYDPIMVLKNHPDNLILKKETFTIDTNIEKARLLVGYLPCNGMEVMIDKACQEDLDFQIYLCPCSIPKEILSSVDSQTFDTLLPYFNDILLNDLREKIDCSSLGTLKTESLQEYGGPYPVIYNKRRK